MATPTPARPYRFPALPEEEDEQAATRCSRRSCGTCGASAVVSCLTLALVKAPYVAGRRCVARLARRRLRKGRARRVRDMGEDDDERQGPRCSKESCDLPRAAAADERAKVSSRIDASSEKVWVDMYQVGLWGFGRLSFSAAAGAGSDSDKDGDTAPE